LAKAKYLLHRSPCTPALGQYEGPVYKRYLVVVVLGDGHRRRNNCQVGMGRSSKGALRAGMVGRVVGSMHRDVAEDLKRSLGYNYEQDRWGNVARILRYGHMNC
jgi:hypothetical protein